MTSRAERLQERFNVIKLAVGELHGRDAAFAAASVGWLRAMQYAIDQALGKVARATPDARAQVKDQVSDEIELMLRGFHAEICSHLGVQEQEALDLGKSFEEVVKDICYQRG